MDVRAVLIIAALFAVLLSAFAAERLRVCRGDRHCLIERAAGLLPAARTFGAHPAPAHETARDTGPAPLPLPMPARTEAEARPRPLP